MRTITDWGILLIKHFESLHDGDLSRIGLQPKLCPAGIVTVGWGHVVTMDGQIFHDLNFCPTELDNLTLEQAEDLLKQDLKTFCMRVELIDEIRNVKNLNPVFFTDHQFDALVSFAYNVGIEALKTSTLLKKINANATKEEITAQFMRWNKCKGKTLEGLTLRRKAEAILYTENTLIF